MQVRVSLHSSYCMANFSVLLVKFQTQELSRMDRLKPAGAPAGGLAALSVAFAWNAVYMGGLCKLSLLDSGYEFGLN